MSNQNSTTDNIVKKERKSSKNLLIWLDGNIDIASQSFKYAITTLQRVISNIGTFTDSDEFINFIKKIEHEKIFVIISGTFGEETVPKVHDMYQINSIFIFCANKEYHEKWTKNWSKIHGVFTEFSRLYESIQQVEKQNEHNSISIDFITINSIKNIRSLNHLHCSFMYTRILKDILLSIQFTSKHFNEFIVYCRKIFADNRFELKKIEQFSKDYKNHTPVWWYTYECFLYPMLNRSLRLMEIDIIIKAGFFINDLHNHIERLYFKQFNRNYHQTFVVYRGQGLYKTDFNHLQTKLGGLMSFNSFLSTSTNRNVSFDYAVRTLRYCDVIGILFVMEINPSKSTALFASITDVSYYKDKEDEVLFSMHTIFRLHSIQPIDGYDRLFQVNLTLTNDDDNDLRQLTEYIGQEIKDSSGWYRLCVLLIKLGQQEKAQELYEIICNRNIDLDQKEQFRSLFKPIHKRPNKNKVTQTNFSEDSFFRLQLPLQVNSYEEAESLIKYGMTYYNIEQYEKALRKFEDALHIQQKLLPSNHPNLGISYVHIGNVYSKTNQFSQALSYYKKALKIQEQSLPSNHPDIDTTFNSINKVYKQLNDYTNTSSFSKRTVDIGQRSLRR